MNNGSIEAMHIIMKFNTECSEYSICINLNQSIHQWSTVTGCITRMQSWNLTNKDLDHVHYHSHQPGCCWPGTGTEFDRELSSHGITHWAPLGWTLSNNQGLAATNNKAATCVVFQWSREWPNWHNCNLCLYYYTYIQHTQQHKYTQQPHNTQYIFQYLP